MARQFASRRPQNILVLRTVPVRLSPFFLIQVFGCSVYRSIFIAGEVFTCQMPNYSSFKGDIYRENRKFKITPRIGKPFACIHANVSARVCVYRQLCCIFTKINFNFCQRQLNGLVTSFIIPLNENLVSLISFSFSFSSSQSSSSSFMPPHKCIISSQRTHEKALNK